VLVLGLTGGIGSGKTTVSTLLEAKGAAIVDADRIARELQQPGAPVFTAMVDAFGPGIVADDGTLDRQAVADIVFHDAEALKTLNGLTHPAIGRRIVERIAELAETDQVVILDVPLLVGSDQYETAGTIVVDVDPEIAIARLVEFRGFDEADARARLAAQQSREDRLALADVVIDNSGPVEALGPQIEALWARIGSGEFGTP
jgi:dephospho-CoA kinase